MSILIKGLKMPTSCLKGGCPLDGFACQLWEDKYWSRDESPYIMRHKNCPLIELSDNGDLPTIEPKRGKWGYAVVREYPIGYNLAKCSNCGWTHYSRPGEKGILTAEDVATYFKYCPHCGKEMEVNNLLKSELNY